MKRVIGIFAGFCAVMTVYIACAATGETLVTTQDGVAVHTRPDAEAPVILALEQGHQLKELRRSGGWVKAIIYGTTGQDGWVREAQVAPSRDESAEATTRQTTKRQGRPLPTTAQHLDFVLVVSGSPQAFKASCLLLLHDGKRKQVTIEGQQPSSYEFDTDAVDCRVDREEQHAGPLDAALYSGTDSIPLAANRTDEAFGCVHIRSNGPWGQADGRRCSRVIRYRNRR